MPSCSASNNLSFLEWPTLLYACSVDRESDPHDKRERVMSVPFDAIRIGTIELENRLAMAPVKTALGTRTGPGSR